MATPTWFRDMNLRAKLIAIFVAIKVIPQIGRASCRERV